MNLRLHSTPVGDNLKFLTAWPGMGMLASISADYIRKQLDAKKIGELVTFHNSVTFNSGILKLSKQKHQLYQVKDLIICIGEAQPLTTSEVYDLANILIDFALKNHITKIYTIAASLSAYEEEPLVFGIGNSKKMLKELQRYHISISKGEGKITGLNGVFLGLASERGLNGLCLLGQIKYGDIPQPRTALHILHYLTKMLDITIDFKDLEKEAIKLDNSIQEAIKKFQPKKTERGLEYIG
jgi:proteasome assembly chaperone (PAC2) family protein